MQKENIQTSHVKGNGPFKPNQPRIDLSDQKILGISSKNSNASLNVNAGGKVLQQNGSQGVTSTASAPMHQPSNNVNINAMASQVSQDNKNIPYFNNNMSGNNSANNTDGFTNQQLSNSEIGNNILAYSGSAQRAQVNRNNSKTKVCHTDNSNSNLNTGAKAEGKKHQRGTSNPTNNRVSQQAEPVSQSSPFVVTSNSNPNMTENQNNQQMNFNFMGMNQQPFQFTTSIPNNLTGANFNPAMVTGQPMAQQPQVHFIAKQQKFYGISPDRAPLIFNGSADKRPYTAQSLNMGGVSASGTAAAKRIYNNNVVQMKQAQHNSAIAALYLGSKTSYGGNGGGFNFHQPGNSTNQSKLDSNQSAMNSQMQSILPPSSSLANNSNGFSSFSGGHMSNGKPFGKAGKGSKTAKGGITSKEQEALYEEAIKMKMLVNTHREENVKLKTKVKILENEMARKERAMEDFFQQNQFILNAQKQQSVSGGNMGPIAQTAAKYQQETFLVMSLKKQVKELKMDVIKKDEELQMAKKNIKNTKFFEIDQEIKTYKEECQRLRTILQQVMSQTPNSSANPHTQSIKSKSKERELATDMTPTTQNLEVHKELSSNVSNHTNNSNGTFQRTTVDAQKQIEFQLYQKDQQIKIMEQNMMDMAQQFKSLEERHQSDQNAKEEQQVFQQRSSKKPETSKDLIKARKMIREKDQELRKVKQELADLQRTAIIAPAEKEKDEQKMKELKTQVANSQIQLKATRSESQKKDQTIAQLKQELGQANKQIADQQDKVKREQANSRKHQLKVEMLQKENDKIKSLHSEPSTNDLKHQNSTSSAVQKQTSASQNMNELKGKYRQELALLSLFGCSSKLDRVELAEKIKTSLDKYVDNPMKEFSDLIQNQSIESLAISLPKVDSPQNDDYMQTIWRLLHNHQDKLFKELTADKITYKQFRTEIQSIKDLEISEEQFKAIKQLYITKVDLKDSSVVLNLELIKEQISQVKVIARSPAKEIRKLNEADQNEENNNPKPDDAISYDDDDFEDDQVDKQSAKKETEQKKSSDKKKKEETKEKADDRDKEEEGKQGFDEEQMLDIAEHCFIRIADLMSEKGRSVRGIFTKYSIPEQFPDGTMLELLSPLSFLEGVKEVGIQNLQELEAACLMRVLAKPELNNAIILNELVLIMENFGVIDNLDDEEEEEYMPDDEDGEAKEKGTEPEEKPKAEDAKQQDAQKSDNKEEEVKEAKPQKKKTRQIKIEELGAKGLKILKKLARFLLQRYLHPREFFGPAITKKVVHDKDKEFHIDVIQKKDFYLQIKLASIRKTLKDAPEMNNALKIDKQNPDLFYVKRLVKVLEEVAEGEQSKMIEEEMAERAKMEAEHPEQNHTADNQNSGDEITSPASLKSPSNSEGKKIRGKENEDFPGGRDRSDMQNQKDYLSNYFGNASNSLRDEAEMGGRFGGMMRFGGEEEKKAMGGTSRMLYANAGHFQLNTIEEDKHETQTSNYQDEMSEREESRLMGSQKLRGSKIMGELGLDDDSKRSIPKMGPEFSQKSLSQTDENPSSGKKKPTDKIDQQKNDSKDQDKNASKAAIEAIKNLEQEDGDGDDYSEDQDQSHATK